MRPATLPEEQPDVSHANFKSVGGLGRKLRQLTRVPGGPFRIPASESLTFGQIKGKDSFLRGDRGEGVPTALHMSDGK